VQGVIQNISMVEIKPKSIRIVAIIVIAFSAFIIIGNGMFSLVVHFIGGVQKLVGPTSPKQYPIDYEFCKNIVNLALLNLIFGFFFLIGGIFLVKLNRWARIILTSIVVMFLSILIFMSIKLVSLDIPGRSNQMIMLSIIFAELFMIVLSLALLIYLNRKEIKKYFV